MKHLLRMAAFRALSPDDGAGSGSASESGAAGPAMDADEQAANDALDQHFDGDAAYKAALGEEGGEDAEEEDEEESEEEDESTVADADEEADADGDHTESPTDGIPEEIATKYPIIEFFASIEAGLEDPESAPQTLRWFADNVAKKHGTTVEEMLGLAPGESKREAAPDRKAGADKEPTWQEMGFDSKEEFDLAPEYERKGYATPGEFKLANEVAELKAMLNPLAQQQAEAQAKAAAEASKARWEGAIGKIAPRAIASVEKETGWRATPEQALEAAREFPELASQPGRLADAIYAKFGRTIAQSSRSKAAPKKAATVPEMPEGRAQQGSRVLDPTKDGYEQFAASVAAQY